MKILRQFKELFIKGYRPEKGKLSLELVWAFDDKAHFLVTVITDEGIKVGNAVDMYVHAGDVTHIVGTEQAFIIKVD